jgi:hypothetical protein
VTELRVPTNALDVEIVCADGAGFVGRIFLPVASSHHSGEMRPDEWMNDSTPFFPFLPVGATTALILNKAEVVVLTVAASPPPEDGTTDIPKRRVQVECRERVVAGVVIIDMPEGHQRVLDYLNGPGAFLIVHDGEREHLVRKTRITRVVDTGEA